MQILPKEGLEGLKQNWQSDLIAAASVAIVALPLALGIAMASGVPPVAGITSAIIGGVVTTFFRGSHVAINGPAAGLIAVILGSIELLNDGSGHALNYVLAAIVVSGAVQVLMGLLKLGRFADIFHSSVIRGILAAIGIIIIAKQIHVALGTNAKSTGIIDSLIDVVTHLSYINPFVFIISFSGLLLLIFSSKISYRFFHLIPTPMWVLIISVPFVYAFDFFDLHSISFFSESYEVGPHLLVSIPDNIREAILFPDFSKINTLNFWGAVLSITMVASIESLASSKAVDKLDPYRRKTDLNKDLIGIGLSTMISGAIGGLPIITVIVRSTVNVHNHAKTRWSNLYHGILLLGMVLVFTPLIVQVPLCALATLLVYTGYKLTSPKVFKHVYDQGIEQFIYFTGTLLITLFTNLLIGIFGGLLLALITHYLLANVSVINFLKLSLNSKSNLIRKSDGVFLLKVRGIANFLSAVKIDKLIKKIPKGSNAKIDFSHARLVDFSILEHIYDYQRDYNNEGGQIEVIGLDQHISSSTNKLALKILTTAPLPLSRRQRKLEDLAKINQLHFEANIHENMDYLESFYYFKSRPLERMMNCMSHENKKIKWKICDITFEEGAYMSSELYDTSLGLIELPYPIPKFSIEKGGLLDKYLDVYGHKDIDYVLYHGMSDEFIVKVENEAEMDAFLSPELKGLLENSGFKHLESNGEAILVFTDLLRLAHIDEYNQMLNFMFDLKSQV